MAKLSKSQHFDSETPKYLIQLVVDDFSLNLKKKELLNLLKMMEYITAYRKFLDSYNKTIKYKFLRPHYAILEKEQDDGCSSHNGNPNARMWWKYAIE